MNSSLIAMVMVFTFFSFLVPSEGKKPKTVRVEAGESIEGFGFAVDANYEKRLDPLVPGYRLLNVAIVNNSFQILLMNPEKDKWIVKTKGGKKYEAFIDLSRENPVAWKKIPKRAQNLLSYPLAIPIGAHVVLDLYVPEAAPLEKMQELEMAVVSIGTTFRIKMRQ